MQHEPQLDEVWGGMMGDEGLSACSRVRAQVYSHFPRALIREPPLRKHTCRQPTRHCPATHTGPAYTRTNANTLANRAKTRTHTHTFRAVSEVCSEFGLLVLIWFVREVEKQNQTITDRQAGHHHLLRRRVFLSAGQDTAIRCNRTAQPVLAHMIRF